MGLTKEGLTNRQAQTEQQLGKLALERVQLAHRIEELDKNIFAMQVVVQANSLALKDLDTEAAIEAAKTQEVKPNE